LEQVAAHEGADEGVGDDVEQEVHRAGMAGGGGVLCDGLGIERGRVGVDAGAGLHPVDHEQADDERDGGDDLEIDQCLYPHPADLFHVAQAGDPHDDGREDDRADQHLDELDERVAQRLQLLAQRGVLPAEQHAGDDGQEDLDIDIGDETFHGAAWP